MKKIVFALLPFLFLGCSNFFRHDFEIKNDSSRTVSFTLENYPDEPGRTLGAGESVSLELYDHPRLNFGSRPPRVSYTSGESSARIFDIKPVQWRAQNLSDRSIVISEEGGNLGDSFGDTVSVPAHGSADLNVYTNSPRFKATDSASSDMTELVKFMKL